MLFVLVVLFGYHFLDLAAQTLGKRFIETHHEIVLATNQELL
jgi:hypothetical protein